MSEDIKARLRRLEESPEAAYQEEDLYHACAEAADYIEALEAEVADLKREATGYLAVFATRYATWAGWADGELHPQHFDRLKELGARTDDFTRAALRPDREGDT